MKLVEKYRIIEEEAFRRAAADDKHDRRSYHDAGGSQPYAVRVSSVSAGQGTPYGSGTRATGS